MIFIFGTDVSFQFLVNIILLVSHCLPAGLLLSVALCNLSFVVRSVSSVSLNPVLCQVPVVLG